MTDRAGIRSEPRDPQPGDDDGKRSATRVRDALGADARRVEEVRVAPATTYQQLPAPAIGRLGARPGQKNLLLRVVLRDLDTTLTREAADQALTAVPGLDHDDTAATG